MPLAPSVLLTASVALIVSGCAAPADLSANVVRIPPADAAGGTPGQGAPLAAPNGTAADGITVTPRQRAYLDALTDAGVRRSTELAALSIGSYICQGRAAGQTDQAVWDFVFPMVRGDIDDLAKTRDGDTAPTAATHSALSARETTAQYLRVATERLC